MRKLDAKNHRGFKADKEDVVIGMFRKVVKKTTTFVIQMLIAAG